MPQIVFAPFRIRVPQQYLVGEESPGLKAFRRLLPPFVHVEVVQPGTPEYDDLRVHSVTLEAGENFNSNVVEYMSRLIDDRMGQATRGRKVQMRPKTGIRQIRILGPKRNRTGFPAGSLAMPRPNPLIPSLLNRVRSMGGRTDKPQPDRDIPQDRKGRQVYVELSVPVSETLPIAQEPDPLPSAPAESDS